MADSLLDEYKSMNFVDLYNKVGTTEQIDIQNLLQLNSSVDISSFSATASISKHPSPLLSDRVVTIKISVVTTENGVKKETTLEGYKRK